MSRAYLEVLVQNSAGDAQSSVSVTLYEVDGTTLLAQTLYAAASGGTTLSNPLTTNSLGRAVAYTATAQRAIAEVAGVQTVVDIEQDPADVVTLTGSQTLTNKTLTSPALTTPTISTLTTAGDTMYGTGSGALSRLGIGTAFQELVTNSGATAPSWVTGVIKTITAAGDLIYGSAANTVARLAKGTAFQELTMNSGATAPQWSSGALALAAAAGDTFYATAANTLAKLSKGTAFQELVMNSGATAPQWSSGPLALAAAAGDIFYATAANALAKLSIGSTHQKLAVVSGLPAWQTSPQAASAVGSTSAPTTSSTSYVDLTDMSCTLTTTGGDLLVAFSGTFFNGTGANAVFVALSLDGAAEVAERYDYDVTANNQHVISVFHRFAAPSAASHTVKARWKVGGGTATAAGVTRSMWMMET